MMQTQWAVVLLALSASRICAQQAMPEAQPTQTESETVPITPYKPIHLSLDEQLQTCPAKTEFHPEVDGIYKVG